MLTEPIEGTILSLGRTADYAIRISKFALSKEHVELGAVGYQVLNTSTGVIEVEGSQLHQAVSATDYLQKRLDEARNPPGDSPSDIFDN